eukprot:3428564-Alexandrium_andersonii.AAC.1
MPNRPNVYSDGAVADSSRPWLSVAGWGVWFPEGIEVGRVDVGVSDFWFERELCGGRGLWSRLNGPMISSTRAEAFGLWVALLHDMPVFAAIDNAGVIARARALLRSRGETVKPWQLRRDGDIWERIAGAIKIRGLHSLALKKVRSHTTQQEMEAGAIASRDRFGNAVADMLAERGRCEGGRAK